MRRMLLAAVLVLLVSCAGRDEAARAAAGLPIKWEVNTGVQSPESAYFDAASGVIFVSNVGGGGGAAKDGDGFISKLSRDGKLLQAKWVTGLNAPKGMRSSGGVLWVSDVDRLLGIDIAEGKIRESVEIPTQMFLNDVACDAQGRVYVSDTRGDKIYRYHQGKVTLLAEGARLETPNGLLVEGDRLVVAGWGLGVGADLSTQTPGQLFSLDLAGGDKRPISREPLGNLDGVESLGEEGYIVSDWVAGKVFHVQRDGQTRLLVQLPSGTADVGYVPASRLLIVPQMLESKITAFQLPTANP